jgi:hypothetical protein
LYGYAIYITASSTVKLPLDFAKETASNSIFSRSLADKGWHIIGYVGTTSSKVAQTLGNCLDGLVRNDAQDTYKFSVITDLTGTVGAADPADDAAYKHRIRAAGSSSEIAGGATKKFYRDYGYAVYTTVDSLILKGDRSL